MLTSNYKNSHEERAAKLTLFHELPFDLRPEQYFFLFLKLPKEMQLLIWEFAAAPGQKFSQILYVDASGESRNSDCEMILKIRLTRSSLMSTCQLSRWVATKTWNEELRMVNLDALFNEREKATSRKQPVRLGMGRTECPSFLGREWMAPGRIYRPGSG